MSFMPMNFGGRSSGGHIPGEGPKNARIAIVGEAGGAEEDKTKRPFVGNAGRVLEQCMHAANLIRGETYLTNVIKLRPPGNDISPYYNQRTGAFTEQARPFLEELIGELNEIKPNIVVATGNIPMAALTRRRKGVTAYRGYIESPVNSTGYELPPLSCQKVLITLHPSTTFFRGEKHGTTGGGAGKGASPYIGRYYISHDLRKAKRESESPILVRPKRETVVPTSADEAIEWIKALADTGRVSFDIEVMNFEVSLMSLSCDPSLGVVLNFLKYSEFDELRVVRALAQYIIQNPKVIKVPHNGIFDFWFIAERYGIIVHGPVEDTLIGHSIMYIDFAKSLGFLGSIYCGAQEFWKDLVKFDNPKENA